jgi:hypothetical protein
MKNLRKIYLDLPAIITITVLLIMISCNFNISTANISKAEFAKEVPGGQPVKIGTTYRPGDGPFHLFVVVSNGPEDTKVKASWYGVDGAKSELIDENEVTLGNNSEIDFSLSLPRPWPVGNYKVDLFLNGKFDRSIPFDVKE